MWGTSSPDDKLAGDLAKATEATKIAGRRSDRLMAGKLSPRNFGLLQQHLPGGDLSRCSKVHKKMRLLDDLVGALLEEQRNIEAERLGGLDIDRKRELNGELDGKLRQLCATENAIDVGC